MRYFYTPVPDDTNTTDYLYVYELVFILEGLYLHNSSAARRLWEKDILKGNKTGFNLEFFFYPGFLIKAKEPSLQ